MTNYHKTSNIIQRLLLCVFLVLSHVVLAETLPNGVAKITSVEGITEYRLGNGLKVLLFPDVSKPTVTVNVTYLVGSRHENYGETGMAHLLEHLMFKGAEKSPDIIGQFNKRGMTFNGTTWLDRTNYYEFFQAGDDNLKWAIDMEAERMVHSFIAKKDLDSEMTVVRNEFENGENSPFSLLIKRAQSVAYDWHGYGRSTIGNRSDIENVKIANLQAFYRTYYQPDNAVLLVAGKFDAAKTLGWISAAFGAIPKPQRSLPEFWTVEPAQDGERSFTVRRKGDFQIVGLVYKVPSALHPDNLALSYMSEILGDTPNGRLHKQLAETGKASQVMSFGLTGFAPGLQIIGAMVKKGDPIEPVRDALIAIVENFANNPPSAEEMQRAQRDFANSAEAMLANPQKVGVALSEAIALGDWRLLFQERDQLLTVTSAQVGAVAARYFKRDNRIVGNFLPEDSPLRAEIPAAPGVADAMKDFKAKQDTSLSEAFDSDQDNIEARTQRLDLGGVKLALLSKKNRGETVAVHLFPHWGDEKNLFGMKAIPGLVEEMLPRGTSKFSRRQLSDEMSRLKISGSLFRYETTREHLADSLRLLAHVLKEANFPEAEFEQLRKQTLVSLEAGRSDPQNIASRELAKYFDPYPEGDVRAVRTLDLQLADVKGATLAQVKAFHRDFYGISHAELAIVGDFDAKETAKVFAEAFGNWPSKAAYERILHRNANVAALRKTIDTPDKEGGFFIARSNLDLNIEDADVPALTLANYVFGGGSLKSRLMDRIRQKDGLSYGGNTQLSPGRIDRAGTFTIVAIAAPQNLLKLEAAINEELSRALKGGFTEEEIANAKSGLLQKRAQDRSHDGRLADGWVELLFREKTYAWSKQFDEKLKALTVDQVNAAFRKVIDPSKMSKIIAGDKAKMDAKP